MIVITMAADGGSSSWLVASHFWSFVMVLVGAGLLWLTVKSMIAGDEARQGPMLRRVCREFGVDRRGRQALQRMAVTTRMASPVSLVLSRGCFDHAARRAILRSSEREALAELRRKLFSDEPPAD